jgi:glycosyltransferase involved in cell wall biosynthesis
MTSLSLVIPCYNEAKNLPELVERCTTLVASRPGTEVIFVDNGSSDETPTVLRERLAGQAGCRSVRVDVNRGYGFGILGGLRAAKGDILAWTHADMQTDPMDAGQGAALFERAQEPERLFVKGRRYGRPPFDVVFTVCMSVFETGLLCKPMWDINAQPTMFHRRFFETWRSPPQDFALDLYAYHSAKCAGLSVKRFPVRFGTRAHGLSHWNVGWVAKKKFVVRTVEYSVRLRRGVLPS